MRRLEDKDARSHDADAAPHDAGNGKRNLKLERAIFDDPADDTAWQVYGDWLQQQQDPRGELISLELQRASETS